MKSSDYCEGQELFEICPRLAAAKEEIRKLEFMKQDASRYQWLKRQAFVKTPWFHDWGNNLDILIDKQIAAITDT